VEIYFQQQQNNQALNVTRNTA